MILMVSYYFFDFFQDPADSSNQLFVLNIYHIVIDVAESDQKVKNLPHHKKHQTLNEQFKIGDANERGRIHSDKQDRFGWLR